MNIETVKEDREKEISLQDFLHLVPVIDMYDIQYMKSPLDPEHDKILINLPNYLYLPLTAIYKIYNCKHTIRIETEKYVLRLWKEKQITQFVIER